MSANLNDFERTTELYVALIQAYLQNKLELDLPQVMSLHHLVDIHIRGFRFDSFVEKNLKFHKLALKRRIDYLGRKHENVLTMKRKKLPQIIIQDLFAQISAKKTA